MDSHEQPALLSSNRLDRLATQFVLSNYAPMASELNELVQRSVEHGFTRFYDRLEAFYAQLFDKSSRGNEPMESQAITMDNVWIYVYFSVGAYCFSTFLFLGELMVFHRQKVLRVFGEMFLACRRLIVSIWRRLVKSLNVFRGIIDFCDKGLKSMLSKFAQRVVHKEDNIPSVISNHRCE